MNRQSMNSSARGPEKRFISYRRATNSDRTLSIVLESKRRFRFEEFNYDRLPGAKFTAKVMLLKVAESKQFWLFECNDYFKSKSCRLEVMYAMTMGIPIYLILFSETIDRTRKFLQKLFLKVASLSHKIDWLQHNVCDSTIINALQQFENISEKDFKNKINTIFIYSRGGNEREKILHRLVSNPISEREDNTGGLEVLVIGDPGKMLDQVDLITEGLRSTEVKACTPLLIENSWELQNLQGLKALVVIFPYELTNPKIINMIKIALENEKLVLVYEKVAEGDLDKIWGDIREKIGLSEPDLTRGLCNEHWSDFHEKDRNLLYFNVFIQTIKEKCNVSSDVLFNIQMNRSSLLSLNDVNSSTLAVFTVVFDLDFLKDNMKRVWDSFQGKVEDNVPCSIKKNSIAISFKIPLKNIFKIEKDVAELKLKDPSLKIVLYGIRFTVSKSEERKLLDGIKCEHGLFLPAPEIQTSLFKRFENEIKQPHYNSPILWISFREFGVALDDNDQVNSEDTSSQDSESEDVDLLDMDIFKHDSLEIIKNERSSDFVSHTDDVRTLEEETRKDRGSTSHDKDLSITVASSNGQQTMEAPKERANRQEMVPDAVSDKNFVDALLKRKTGYGEQLDTTKIKALAEVWRNCKKENLPYIDIPNSIIRKGSLAITNFYKLIKNNGGLDPTYRLSILVLGRASVGKTSLIESIKANNKGVLIPSSARTLGVEMHKIQGNPSKDIFTLINVLDFGGQEDYYATHTLFHRVNGIVLIAFDLSMTIDKSNFDENVLFFIRKIQASNLEGIRFLLVGTKLDLAKEKKIDVDSICFTVINEFKKAEKNTVKAIHNELNGLHLTEIERRSELENLLANRPRLLTDKILKVSCVSRGKALMGFGGERNAKGIPELVNHLQELAMNEGKQLPNIHLKLLETFISRRSQNSISLAEAKQLAVSNKFEKDEDIVAALEIFRDLNEILWFKNDPLLFNVIFVNPVFVMDIIKPIVRHDLIKNPEGGASGLEQYFKNNKMLLDEVSSKLQNQGTISTRILREYFFQDEKYQDVFVQIISFEKLLSLLERFEIGYLVRKGDGDEKLLLPFHIGIGTIAMPSSIYTPKPTNAKLQLVRIWEFVHFFPSGAMTSLAIMLHDLHRVESTLGDNVFQILPNEVCIQILFERQVVDSRIYVQILDSSRVVVRLEITTKTPEGVKSETLKITDRIEKYLQQYPGMLVRRKGIDPEFPQVEVDLDLACQLAAANREDILVNGEAIPLAKLVPEHIHENKFTKQVSFRQGFISELPFLLPDCDKHFFLSHYQIEFGDACANIQLLLSKFGGVCWFDKRADNITMSEMEYGIKSSVMYTLFLSSKVFTRPYVRYELLKAIELEKPILLLHECEPGRPCFDFGGVNKDDVIPSTVPNETDFVQSRGKQFREVISVLLRESESRPFRRRVEEEESMMKKMLEIVTDEQSLKKRQEVTIQFLKPLLT